MAARVVVYVREGCHLCEPAIEVVSQVCSDAGEQWDVVDIDTDPALRARFTDDVPVVEVDGVRVGFWRIRAEAVRAALASDGGQ